MLKHFITFYNYQKMFEIEAKVQRNTHEQVIMSGNPSIKQKVDTRGHRQKVITKTGLRHY